MFCLWFSTSKVCFPEHRISIHLDNTIASFCVLLILYHVNCFWLPLVLFILFLLKHPEIHFTLCPDSFLFSPPPLLLISASSLFILLLSSSSSSSSAYDHQHTDGKPVSLPCQLSLSSTAFFSSCRIVYSFISSSLHVIHALPFGCVAS